MRSGDFIVRAQAENTTVEKIERGRVVRTEHFNGRVDADVKLRALRFNLTNGAPPDERLVYAIHELEEATREYRLSQHTGNQPWLDYTTGRMEAAKQKVRDLQ